jgi:hypothetical protein
MLRLAVLRWAEPDAGTSVAPATPIKGLGAGFSGQIWKLLSSLVGRGGRRGREQWRVWFGFSSCPAVAARGISCWPLRSSSGSEVWRSPWRPGTRCSVDAGLRGDGSTCRVTAPPASGSIHGALLRRLFDGLLHHPVGLNSSRAAAPPLQRLACWISLGGAPSGASPAAPSQSFRRAGIVLEVEEEARLDRVLRLFPGSSLFFSRVSL